MSKIEQEIKELQERLEFLQTELQRQRKESSAFTQYRKEADEIMAHMDDWIKAVRPRATEEAPLSLIFLGACFGEWAARTRYQGTLPGFGGFVLIANGTHILVDPGRGTFQNLELADITPNRLDVIIATHSHWDCVRDLSLVVMAASRTGMECRDVHNHDLRLFADRSVLYGLPMNSQAVLQGSRKNRDLVDLDSEAARSLESRLAHFAAVVPGALSIYDLFVRLDGRFTELELDQQYDIGSGVTLYTRRSYHAISYGGECIPALDIVVRSENSPLVRCVYLSDTEYRPHLAEQYSRDLDQLGPIDVLICNIKTLDVLPYPADHKLRGYTLKHLGWNGAVQLTKDLQEQRALKPSSLVVLRAWGIETVTTLPKKEDRLVAMPEKLRVYEEMFREQTGQNVLAPGITEIQVTAEPRREYQISHIRPPFPSGDFQRFGNLFFASQAMSEVVREARTVAVKDKRPPTVLIHGETGVGKDEFAKAIHQEARRPPNALIIKNAVELNGEIAQAQLFGASKGAFTSAVADKDGWLAAANGGTLIIDEMALIIVSATSPGSARGSRAPHASRVRSQAETMIKADEITDLSWENQTMLLTVLQERKYERVGEAKKHFELTAQVIMTTNRDLQEAIQNRTLRFDFLQRIDHILRLPPLREREGDIRAIITAWRHENVVRINVGNKVLEAAIKVLEQHDWPGNVRQLERVVNAITASDDWSEDNLCRICEHDTGDNPFKSTATAQETNYSDPEDTGQLILHFMAEGGRFNRAEIESGLSQNGLKVKKATILKYLNRLERRGLIKKIGSGPSTRYQILK